MIAVVFSQPSTHRTLQLKGCDARVVRATTADRGISGRHLHAWMLDLQLVGYTADFARAVRGEGLDLVAIRFTVAAAFQRSVVRNRYLAVPDFASLYTAETRAAVLDACRDEFALFGYDPAFPGLPL